MATTTIDTPERPRKVEEGKGRGLRIESRRHHDDAGDVYKVSRLEFADKSIYEGTLKNGKPEGLGTCVWCDGNRYDGEWKNGLMHGVGTYVWLSGQRYDGEWKEGKRDGIGVKTYIDGSVYDGFWRDGVKHGLGVFRPAKAEKRKSHQNSPRHASPRGSFDRDERGSGTMERERGERAAAPSSQEVDDDSPGPTNQDRSTPEPNMFRESMMSSIGDSQIVLGTHGSEKRTVFVREFNEGNLIRDEPLTAAEIKLIFGDMWTKGRKTKKVRRTLQRALKIGKASHLKQNKMGQLIYKEHNSFELMLMLQHGIRYTISKSTANASDTKQHGKLTEKDFSKHLKLHFPRAGSSVTPAHPASNFKWKAYAPTAFAEMRSIFGIDDVEYMLSIAGSTALWQLNPNSKSGCLFLASDDQRFMIKTMRKDECHLLLELLPKYYSHVKAYPNSLINKFLGVYRVKPTQPGSRQVRFMVMNNILPSEVHIHEKYDLKGSTEGRTAGLADAHNVNTILKDLDLHIRFRLRAPQYDALVKQLKADCKFLIDAEVMDYSLLMGVHYPAKLAAHMDHAASLQEALYSSPSHTRPSSHTVLQPTDSVEPHASVIEAALMGPSSPNNLSPIGERGEGPTPSDDMQARTGKLLLYATRDENRERLRTIEERMRGMGFNDQRIRDILELSNLNILGEKLKGNSSKRAPGSVVLMQAMAQARNDTEISIIPEGVVDGGSEEEADQPSPKRVLGISTPAVTEAKDNHPGLHEDVVLCFGIIDILQRYNVRKAFERGFKSLNHDRNALSVAPPKFYADRFLDVLTNQVFKADTGALPAPAP